MIGSKNVGAIAERALPEVLEGTASPFENLKEQARQQL